MIRTYGVFTGRLKALKVLLLDGIEDRAKSFKIHGDNWILCRIALDELQHALRQETWDLVVMSSFFGGNDWEPLLPIPELCKAYEAKAFKGVMLITPVASDGLRQFRALTDQHVPVVYYPYDINNPNEHKVVEL